MWRPFPQCIHNVGGEASLSPSSQQREPCTPSTQPKLGGGGACSQKNLLGKGFSCSHLGTVVAREHAPAEAHCGAHCEYLLTQ